MVYIFLGLFSILTKFNAAEGVESPSVEFIGMSIKEVYETLGPPDIVKPLRDEVTGQDDVIFFFAEHIYLYFYKNVVCQVRFDREYTRFFSKIRMKMTTSQVKTILEPLYGPPMSVGNSLYYYVPGQLPVTRIRLIFSADQLIDAYIYRAELERFKIEGEY